VSSWDVLRVVTEQVDGSGIPAQPPKRLSLLWQIGLGSLAVVFRKQNVAVLLSKLNVQAAEIVLSEQVTFHDVLFTSLWRRRPAFVLPGTLAPVCRYFGVDENHILILRCRLSGVASCFGHLHGREVVADTVAIGDGKFLVRQWDGVRIARKVLGALVPEVIEASQTRLITTRLPGHPRTPWMLTEDVLQASILAALEPLKQIYDAGQRTGQADDELIEALKCYVRKSSRQAQLQAGLDAIQQWDRKHVKTVLVHGDYWLNNVLFSEGRLTGVVDWDHSRPGGCAGLDALHLAFMSYAMWSKVPVSELLADIFTEQWHFPWLAAYCVLVRETFSLRAEDLKYLAILIWLNYFPYFEELHSGAEYARDPQVEGWYDQMIPPMGKAISSLDHERVLRSAE
jgi:Phosphotransferase enzyme family